ncbi:hypothetical protein L249_1166 [Ophiocordyceps polyrhachis-furcata BCC 54312]|uniref:Exostosin GT47 domain-containing protein n=1 Tax=Ophiocordyceps polyrhachis-furcata BCC 54312 TaxID=1330021 RepID=A0A367LDJ3_9HYPO|nr:hypothetical protein L249_1166 [Ophiocordyceps polyrhachis-furcata BCC 54312]
MKPVSHLNFFFFFFSLLFSLFAAVAALAGRPMLAGSNQLPVPAPLDVKRITYTCGVLKPLTFWYYACSGRDPRLPYVDGCGLRQRFPNIENSFPPAFRRMLRQRMNMTRDDSHRLLLMSVSQCDPHTTYQRVKWFEERAMHGNHTVCWPDFPDFSPRDFEEFGGVIAALFVRPETIGFAVPRRFMDLPPGYLSKQRIHYIYHASYSYQKLQSLRTDFRRMPIFGHEDILYPPLGHVRDHFDTWGGRVGRLLLASMRRSTEYGCSYHRGCVCGRQRAGYGEPLQPADYSYAIDHWLRSLVTNKPFAVTFSDVPDSIAPTTLWLSAE